MAIVFLGETQNEIQKPGATDVKVISICHCERHERKANVLPETFNEIAP